MGTAEVILSLFVVVMMIVSLLSNVLVLICFLSSAEIRKQVPGMFIINLTLSNLLTTALNMPLTLVGMISQGQPGGDAFCRTVGFLETFLTTNSMLSMAALSIDRWIAVVFPLSYNSKMRYQDAAVILGYTWLHSVCFPVVAVCLSWVGYSHLYASCTLCHSRTDDRIQFVVFTVAFHSLSFLLSLLVLCLTYLKVLKVARFHCKRIDVITMQTLVLLVDIHPSVRQRCLEEQKQRRQRATKKISTFIGTFILCFAPYVITRLVELSTSVSINPLWGILSKCLAYSKAVSDPFVYSLLRHQYKKTWMDIINRFLKRSSLNSSALTGETQNSNFLQTAE
ncbi:G-protein coupled receptor 26 [Callorhinchus milii]|uniref:G-protein coupled receptor 26 n=1 Tax=Callorhinchus milii TaxID=7868 RepID=UPI00045757D2|nr:G-protein coupled receptor 26 [Callorhinchus milii]|eukprot:gi/632971423/ref/XP_007902165.1/ PREDICTED: G-protein coupled receptor 26 [Callorhinchus milii]